MSVIKVTISKGIFHVVLHRITYTVPRFSRGNSLYIRYVVVNLRQHFWYSLSNSDIMSFITWTENPLTSQKFFILWSLYISTYNHSNLWQEWLQQWTKWRKLLRWPMLTVSRSVSVWLRVIMQITAAMYFIALIAIVCIALETHKLLCHWLYASKIKMKWDKMFDTIQYYILQTLKQLEKKKLSPCWLQSSVQLQMITYTQKVFNSTNFRHFR